LRRRYRKYSKFCIVDLGINFSTSVFSYWRHFYWGLGS